METQDTNITQIDVGSVLRSRLGKFGCLVPGFLVRRLERVIRQDELNKILRDIGDSDGVAAADISLTDLGVTSHGVGIERIPHDGRYIFASNHPLGGVDGLALISLLGHHYNGEIRFIVNDLLMAVKPLRSVFLPVNKHGAQNRMSVEAIEAEYESDRQMITFPAGLCSRQLDDGTIGDLEWKKFVVTSAVRYKRDIIPVFVDARNSASFYRKARRREKLGIKLNIEMVLLPGEMFNMNGQTINIYFGSPVSWQSLAGKNAKESAAMLRAAVYKIKPTEQE